MKRSPNLTRNERKRLSNPDIRITGRSQKAAMVKEAIQGNGGRDTQVSARSL